MRFLVSERAVKYGEQKMELESLAADIADAIVQVDSSRECFRSFKPGAGPYGEPQLVKLIAKKLSQLPGYGRGVRTKRNPDLLIPNQWALEFKITRPFGVTVRRRRVGP